MSKFIFRPVSTIIAALNEPGLMAQRLALFAEGPVVIAVIDYSTDHFRQAAVVTNFRETDTWFKSEEWTIGDNVVGYVPYIHGDEVQAHNYAWTLFLNMTHTQFDLVVRRKAWHAFKAAEASSRLFSDLGEDYFDHGVHPSTLDDLGWVNTMIRRLDHHLFDNRFFEVVGHMSVSRLPKWVRDEIAAMADDLCDQRRAIEFAEDILGDGDPGDFVDQKRETHYVPNYINDDGSFPAWDDPEHGLEARMSRQYELHHGAYA